MGERLLALHDGLMRVIDEFRPDEAAVETTFVNSNAVAYATLQFAMNTEAVNGVRGKGNFKQKQKQGSALAAKFNYDGPRAKR